MLDTCVVTPSDVWTTPTGLVTSRTVSILREQRTGNAKYAVLDHQRERGRNVGDEVATAGGEEVMAAVEEAPLKP